MDEEVISLNKKKATASAVREEMQVSPTPAHDQVPSTLETCTSKVLEPTPDSRQEKMLVSPSPSADGGSSSLETAVCEFLNPTVTNFQFEVQHNIRCVECGNVVVTKEKYNDLSLDMPRRHDPDVPRSIQDALDIYFIDENVEYNCEAKPCKSKKSRTTHKVSRLPRLV